MPYCPKCGSSIDEKMSFCPTCGTALKNAPISQAAPENQQKNQETPGIPAKVEVQRKNQYGCINYLVGGLILVTIGIFAMMDLTSRLLSSGQIIAIMLVIIGIIIISGAIYVITPVEKYFQHLISHPKKAPANT